MKRIKSLLGILFLVGAVLGGAWTVQGARHNRHSPPAPQTATFQRDASVRETEKAKPSPASAEAPRSASEVSKDGEYTDRDHLAAYIVTFGCLPRNFITKAEARRLGWQGGPVEPYAPGKSIGGDRFGNYERSLPNGSYRECDVDTRGRPRGAKRIIFSNDRRIYYTEDHYRTFKRIH